MPRKVELDRVKTIQNRGISSNVQPKMEDPNRNWGEQLPLAVGLSLIDNENKARKNLKLTLFKHFKGIIALSLNPKDGVVKQTGIHTSHYTWWRTKAFDLSNLKMLEL